MNHNEISNLIKENLSGDGSLYLTPSKATYLIYRLEAADRLIKELQEHIDMVKLVPRENANLEGN